MFIKKKWNKILRKLSGKNGQLGEIAALKKQIQLLEMTQSRTENYLNNIIRVIPASIYWKDSNCVILGGNLLHAKLAGFSDPKEVLGKTEHDFAWKEHAEEIIQNDKLIMSSGVGRQLEEVGALSDGKLHTFLTCKDPLRDKDNNIIGIIGVSTDITAFKELQEELLEAKALAAQSQVEAAHAKAVAEEEMRKTIMVLVGDIVHDLRTPLTMIKTVTDLLETALPILLEIVKDAVPLGSKKKDLLTENSWEYLFQGTPITYLQNSVKLADDFINTTLTELSNANKAMYSELSAQDLTPNSSRRIIDNTLKAYPFTDFEKTKINKNIESDFHFMGNSILMMKLLFNLIKNAFDQIHLHGKGDITISTGKEENYNLIRIKDTASGASPEVLSNMFNGYFTTKKNGTGIGLAFCKKIMLSFGGDIICNSVYGESMEFILKFPQILN